MPKITDLACELLQGRPQNIDGIEIKTNTFFGIKTSTTIISTDKAAEDIGKPVGNYVNIETKEDSENDNIINILTDALKNQIINQSKILVVGLGNHNFVADSLGPQVLSNITTGDRLLTFQPNVSGVTGINSVDAIKAITKLSKPSTVIVIDSLVSASPERIGTNYQISTSGIVPGSGIGRDNKKLDKKFLGVPVIAVGIPVCTIMLTKNNKVLHVVPKDIDDIVSNCSFVIGSAINNLG